MARIYNFSAGPSTMPESVLKKAASQLLEYGSSGQSVIEMSHRSPEYDEIIKGCEAMLREVMSIPQNYKVLFVHGGATMQFSMVPINLMNKTGKADYVVSGMFSKKAAQEAKLYGDITVVASGENCNFTKIPDIDPAKLDSSADYLHICQNNTVYGTTFSKLPQTGNVPLVADLSSCILSEPMDVSRYGLIYAGAQKNMGPAGVCVVIVREDLIGEPRAGTQPLLSYKTYAENESMYNTPSTYTIYIMGLVLEWLKNEVGGLAEMQKINQRKAAVLYDFLDQSKLFRPVADKACRSVMNVTFVTGDKDLDKRFCTEAQKAGFYNLKGHRAVGGMRASIYNAMPQEGVRKLVDFMAAFEKDNG